MATAQDDHFDSLFEHRDRPNDRLGNRLLELEAQVDWEAFRLLLEQLRNKVRKSSARRKPWDEVLMCKGIVLGSLYKLSNEQLEFQIEDLRSFQRFVRCQPYAGPQQFLVISRVAERTETHRDVVQ